MHKYMYVCVLYIYLLIQMYLKIKMYNMKSDILFYVGTCDLRVTCFHLQLKNKPFCVYELKYLSKSKPILSLSIALE